MQNIIPVTRSLLPPLEQYIESVRDIFESRILTNQGRYVRSLEDALREYLGIPCLGACANGTLALQLGIRLLGLNGKKVITTPFTYVATLSALLWEGCEPVFADIDPSTLCIDPNDVCRKLERHPDTAGILPVHVFGNACDVKTLENLAGEKKLAILYDAAHAFGSVLFGKSLLDYGDASACSFHSTKLFHTVEGGCLALHSDEQMERMGLLRSFGHDCDNYECLGINAKLSELHAAMGLALLPMMKNVLETRAALSAIYDSILNINSNPFLRSPRLAAGLQWNNSYYPVIFTGAAAKSNLEKVMAALAAQNIHPRRYFFPSLTRLPYIQSQNCPIADDIAERIICLPLWADMDKAIVQRTGDIVMGTLNEGSKVV